MKTKERKELMIVKNMAKLEKKVNIKNVVHS